MSILSLFKKQKESFGDYTQSRNATRYERIAERLSTSAQHVYEIAHGKLFHSHDDRVIWYALLDAGIVSEW